MAASLLIIIIRDTRHEHFRRRSNEQFSGVTTEYLRKSKYQIQINWATAVRISVIYFTPPASEWSNKTEKFVCRWINIQFNFNGLLTRWFYLGSIYGLWFCSLRFALPATRRCDQRLREKERIDDNWEHSECGILELNRKNYWIDLTWN